MSTSLCFIHLFIKRLFVEHLIWWTHTKSGFGWLLCVSNQTNRQRRREVGTLGSMDTKSEGDNMVSVL